MADNRRCKGNIYCCVPQCKSYYFENVSFHTFPTSDKILRTKWIHKLKIGKNVTPFMRVCSKHFRKEDYFFNRDIPCKVYRLKKNTIPSQNLPKGTHELSQNETLIQQRTIRKENREKLKIDASHCQSHIEIHEPADIMFDIHKQLETMSSSNERFTHIKRGKVLPAPAREIIANVINFLKNEAESGLSVPLKNFKQRALYATGVSDSTYRSIMKEAAKIEKGETKGFITPGKIRRIPKKIINLEKAKIIRELVHNFYVTEKRPPTIDGLLAKINSDKVPFNSSKRDLWNFLRIIGFQWVSTRNKRKILIESNNSRYKRINYLRKLLEYRQQGRPIVYVDERYIDDLQMQNFCRDYKNATIKSHANRRLVVVYAGGEMGFISNCLSIFISESESSDNDPQRFLKWVEKQLVPNLPSRSVLVIDNSIYQNIKSEEPLYTKKDMIEWLQKMNVCCNMSITKPELSALIETHRTESSFYILDELLEKYGHNILRLPLYHHDLSPITEIWDDVKNWIISKNVALKIMEDVQHLVEQKFDTITKYDWNQFCDHVKEIENKYMEREDVFDKITDELQILTARDQDQDEDDQGVDEVMEIEEVSDDEPETICNSSSTCRSPFNFVEIPIKKEVDSDVPIQIKQEEFNDDELTEISEWKPPLNLCDLPTKQELYSDV